MCNNTLWSWKIQMSLMLNIIMIEKTVKSVPTVPGKGQQEWIQAGFSRASPTI